jgi:hypothetical protein
MFYLRILLNQKKIDEIHFWQFTNNPEDIHYLESISNIHKSLLILLNIEKYFQKFIIKNL